MTLNSLHIEQFLDEQGQAGFVKLSVKGRRNSVRRLCLPVTIGSSSQSDVIVNSQALDPIAKMLYAKDGRLMLWDFAKDRAVEIQSLRTLNISAVGPVKGSAEGRGRRQALRELAAAERATFDKIPAESRKWLGGGFSQPLRLGIWTVLALLLLLLVAWPEVPSEQTVAIDQSELIIDAEFDEMLRDGIGSVDGYRDFAKGFRVGIELAADKIKHDLLLRMSVKGLDEYNELTVLVGDQKLYSSGLDQECKFAYCEIGVRLPAGVLGAGKNVITFQHEPEDSDYVIKNILVSNLTEWSPAERVAFERRYERAERAFNERHITYQNIITAFDECSRIRAFIQSRAIPEEFSAKVSALYSEVFEARKRLKEDLEFQAERDLQLSRLEEAKAKLEALLKFYPERTSDQHVSLRMQIQKIEDLIK